MLFYYVILVVLLLLCVGRRDTERGRLLLGCICLFLLAALRSSGVDNDYDGYVDYYSNVLDSDFENVEFSFIFISHLVDRYLGNPAWLFVIYAFLGVSLKYLAIDKLTDYKTLSLFFYYAGFFPLWEMTQIRVAVAGGLMLLSIPYLVNRRYWRYGACFTAAVFFHFSALVMLLITAVKPHTINKRAYALAVPLCAALALAKVDLVRLADLLPFAQVTLRLGAYEQFVEEGQKVFDFVFLSRCALAYFLLSQSDRLSRTNRYFIPLLKIYFIGLIVHLVLSSVPAVASRLGDLFLVVEFLLAPMMIVAFKERMFGVLACVSMALVFLAFGLHYTQLLKPYSTISMW